jgi:hypothetical protein
MDRLMRARISRPKLRQPFGVDSGKSSYGAPSPT